MARSRGFQYPRRSRRSTDWGAGVVGSEIIQTSSGKSLGTFGGSFTEPSTLVRIRGDFLAFIRVSDTIGEGARYAFGIAIVTDQAFAAGIASIPGPLAEDDWDGWLFHRYGSLFTPLAAQADGAAAGSTWHRWEIDSKAMRKVDDDNMTLIGMVESVFSGTAQVQFDWNSRSLVKLT